MGQKGCNTFSQGAWACAVWCTKVLLVFSSILLCKYERTIINNRNIKKKERKKERMKERKNKKERKKSYENRKLIDGLIDKKERDKKN